MVDVIWLCDVCREAKARADLRFPKLYPRKLAKMVRAGYVPSPDELYDVAHWHDRDPIKPVCVQKVPYLTEEIRRIFTDFDVGNALFHKTTFEGVFELNYFAPEPMYALYAGNPRDTIIGDLTVDYIPPNENFNYGKLPLFPKPGDIIAKKSALLGPDIWHDPNIGHGCFFMSDNIVQALKAAGVAKYFYLFNVPTL